MNITRVSNQSFSAKATLFTPEQVANIMKFAEKLDTMGDAFFKAPVKPVAKAQKAVKPIIVKIKRPVITPFNKTIKDIPMTI